MGFFWAAMPFFPNKNSDLCVLISNHVLFHDVSYLIQKVPSLFSNTNSNSYC